MTFYLPQDPEKREQALNLIYGLTDCTEEDLFEDLSSVPRFTPFDSQLVATQLATYRPIHNGRTYHRIRTLSCEKI